MKALFPSVNATIAAAMQYRTSDAIKRVSTGTSVYFVEHALERPVTDAVFAALEGAVLLATTEAKMKVEA